MQCNFEIPQEGIFVHRAFAFDLSVGVTDCLNE
jgi:hypothetical protein